MYSVIKLTKGAVAIVDQDDFDSLNKQRWQLSSEGYALRRLGSDGHRVTLHMHRVINQTPEGMETDHINGNKLDNRRANLRSCSPSQNCLNRRINKRNTSGCSGVYFRKDRQCWQASITFNGKRTFLGLFSDLEAAKAAYTQARSQCDPI